MVTFLSLFFIVLSLPLFCFSVFLNRFFKIFFAYPLDHIRHPPWILLSWTEALKTRDCWLWHSLALIGSLGNLKWWGGWGALVYGPGGWASDVAVSPAGSVNPRGTHNHSSPQRLHLWDEVQDQRSWKSLLALKSYLDINKVILILQLPNLQLYILAFNSICLPTSGMAAVKRGTEMLRSEVCRFCYEIKWKCWACSVSSN